MVISDLEYIEVVREENQIEGGVASVSGAVAVSSATGTKTAYIFNTANSYTQIIQLFGGRQIVFSSSSGVAIAQAS